MSLPVINIAPLINADAGADSVASQIYDACTTQGFFYVSGHGVDEQLQEKLEHLSKIFFALEVEDKMHIRMGLGGKAWRGYFPVGDELTSGKPDVKEGLYFGTELEADDPRVVSGIPMHGPNLFPTAVPELREAVLAYMDSLTQLGHVLMQGISMSLGLEPTYFQRRFTGDPLTLFRIFHYPSTTNESEGSWGVGEHTDYGLLTILKQDNVGGLQVKSKAGWIEAPPIKGTFICNIGDMLDRITRGTYRSTPHRVLNVSGRSRYSFPFFFDPNFDAKIRPVDSPLINKADDDFEDRWDKSSVHAFEGTYGEYLLKKVGKVFPDLKKTSL